MDDNNNRGCGAVLLNILGAFLITVIINFLFQSNLFGNFGIALAYLFPIVLLYIIAYVAGVSFLIAILQAILRKISHDYLDVMGLLAMHFVLLIPIFIGYCFQTPLVGLLYAVLTLAWAFLVELVKSKLHQEADEKAKRGL